ncbi:MAG: YgiQ family radical SAM protein [Bacteroidaceae bacterium]|nr:YgiQ family radical SAM protein [Bacteroidaceae bacterium]
MQITDFLPTTKKEIEQLGWDHIDVILFSADAYVDHPSFGAAVIGRVLEAEGYNVAIVPQPDWHGDYRDFKKLGKPRLFFGIAPGCMDSMVNKYTANKRLRSEDAYTPDGRHDKRPEYPTIVYTKILKELFPDVPVVLGGIEASMRRLTHYDYWQDRLRPSILLDSGADLLIYGMGEKGIVEVANRLKAYSDVAQDEANKVNPLHGIKQTAYLTDRKDAFRADDTTIFLHSHEQCQKDKRSQAQNMKIIEEQSNMLHAQRIVQSAEGKLVVVEPPFPLMTTAELDRIYDLPFTRLPHPKYRDKRIPAYEMIRHSVTMHRGCFGGCAFCTISAHQGKFVVGRSKESILREVERITHMPDFKGYISDLGGPSANMYGMSGKDKTICEKCRRPSCVHPQICKNLNNNHKELIGIYQEASKVAGVKKCFVGSGVRYDLVLADKQFGRKYAEELIINHVSGRLKVAPEHTSDSVLHLMRKPSFQLFYDFNRWFDDINRRAGLRQQLIPYFISSHPGCREQDMKELATITRRLNFKLEQVQDFTPTPMTISTETWYTGIHPYTLEPVFSARSPQEKQRQNQYFFWYKKEH